jgi:para-aminobenzoate synthetase
VPRKPEVLLIDNYDSYTYNLFQLLGRLIGTPPTVVRNDEVGSLSRVADLFTHVVISPGPGHPCDPRRIGACADLISAAPVPVLGVCLGHQVIGAAFGGKVVSVGPSHGKISTISHDRRGVFARVPQGFQAVRYHSLAISRVHDPLEVTAVAEDGVVMGLRHRLLPLYGVQFHPESILSRHGDLILSNFLGVTPRAQRPEPTLRRRPVAGGAELLVAEVPWRDPEDVFVAHYADRPHAVWLDSARTSGAARTMSYIGAMGGPRGHAVSYRLADGAVQLHRSDGTASESSDIFDFLRHRLASTPVVLRDDAPFAFRGGYVGYLGYGLKALCGGDRTDQESAAPDAAFVYVERFFAFDHDNNRAYAAAVAWPDERPEARGWLRWAQAAIDSTAPASAPSRRGRLSKVRATVDKASYARAFDAVRTHLQLGDTYETNLTFRLLFDCSADHVELYRHLRRVNPAPYGAFLRLPGVTVLSSSPERFLKVAGDGRLEAKPMKGTSPRHADPDLDAQSKETLATDPKTIAENLMIADLLRNDLGRVCAVDTVQVPILMAVESYPTVHQLVTTVTGVLARSMDTVACVRAIFPGGSMTGAPKLRTMEIIDNVETSTRDVYAGALGYFSLSGEADLSIVIRTIVAQGTAMSIGVGGGIVALSDVDDEFAEANLKAAALLKAVGRACAEDGVA